VQRFETLYSIEAGVVVSKLVPALSAPLLSVPLISSQPFQ
jgi:hypothetical protein